MTQFYHGLPYPNGQTYFGGTQDNGTNRGTDAAGPNAWARINGGDGGYVAVNPANTNTIFFETTGLSLRRSTNGGASSAIRHYRNRGRRVPVHHSLPNGSEHADSLVDRRPLHVAH